MRRKRARSGAGRTSTRLVVVGVALQRDQVATLDRVATREHRTRSAMLRLALAQWFAGLAPERAAG